MKRITTAIIIACALSFVVGPIISNVFAGPPQIPMKVLGKATIKQGTTLAGVLMLAPNQVTGFQFTAFKEQTMYIVEVVKPEGKQQGGYVLDGSGFSHFCPVHGEEVMESGMIAVPQSKVDAGDVIIELF